jgi:hypothetical protein
MSVVSSRFAILVAVGACMAAVACDKDPTQPESALALVSCPTGALGVNAPITLSFTQNVSPTSITSANVVVTDAVTGFEIPGSVRRSATNSSQVVFTPSSQLPFDRGIRVRVQNLLSENADASLTVTVCELRTQLPPITELFWRQLPNAGGNDLVGVSLVNPAYAYVAALRDRIFRYTDTTTVSPVTLAIPPYYSASSDVAFVSTMHGFATVAENRASRSVILETFDGGVTFDTIGTSPLQSLNRAYFKPIPNSTTPFGVAAGGRTFSPAYFLKYHPDTKTFAVSSFGGTGGVSDIDFTSDTLKGAASSLGSRIGTAVSYGTVFTTADGGNSWTEIAGAKASDSVIVYRGIAVKASGEIWVTGGNGYVAKLSPSGGGYTVTRVSLSGVASPNPDDPYALIYNDVQFAANNPQIGWIVGARQVGVVGGVPRYEGLIFATRDGGQSWTRQGVLDAPNFGAEFPALIRIDVLTSTAAWIVGNGGVVLRFAGATAP